MRLYDAVDRLFLRTSLWHLTRGLPPRELLPLGLAIFALFAVLGPMIDMMNGARQSLVVMLATTAVSGLLAIAYALGWMRRQLLFIAIGVALHAGWIALAPRLAEAFPALGPEHVPRRLRLDGTLTLALVMSSYSCFLRFINVAAVRYLRARAEIDLAHEIHQVLVPPVDRRIGKYAFTGFSAASGDVGGDLVDVVPLDDGWFGYVADVSGHGVSSGVVMGMFKSALRMRLLQEGTLGSLLDNLNGVLYPLKSSAMYVTAACVRGRDDGTLEYAVAGHLPILRVRGGRVEEITTPQIPVGMFEAYAFTSATADCEPGDLLALLTDGLIEVFDAADRELGLDAVKALLACSADRPLKEIADAIVAKARAHGAQIDDQTLLLFRRA